MSFGQVTAQANRLAARLHAEGLERGDVVLTLVGNRSEWVLAMVACFRLGLVALPCNEQLRAKDLELRLQAAQPRLVVCDERNAEVLEQAGWAGSTLWVPWGELPADPVPPAADLAPDDPCLITFTSGTAGEPKGVLHGQRYLAGQMLQARHWLDARAGDLVWCTAASRLVEVRAERVHRAVAARRRRTPARRALRPRTSGSSCSTASASTCSAWRRPSTA